MVDIKLAFHTKTWTWMNWLAILLFSLFIYIGFVLLGDNLAFFNSYQTASIVFSSFTFYLIVLLISVTVMLYDMHVLILRKEIFTPMSMFFSSIVRRKKEAEGETFRSIVSKFKQMNGQKNIDDVVVSTERSSVHLV